MSLVIPALLLWEKKILQVDFWKSSKGLLLIQCSGFGLLLFLRIPLLNYESGDYTGNLSIWYDTLAQGGFRTLKDPFHDYTPAYLYLMYLGTLLPIGKLLSIKLISLLFEVLAAGFVWKILRHYQPDKPLRAMAGTWLFLLLPTVVANGALWAQCDIIFTSFLLGMLYFILKDRQTPAAVFLGLAFCFKIQSVFIVLLPLGLWIAGWWSTRQLLLIPAVYLLSVLPNALVGRPLTDLLFIYHNQTDIHTALSQFAPNFWQLFGWADARVLTPFAIALTGVCIGFFALFWLRKRPRISASWILDTATLSALLLPYFLPRMHDRYFFLADVLCFIYAWQNPKKWWVALCCSFASLMAYLYFLFGAWEAFPFRYLALVMGAALIGICFDYVRKYIFVANDTRN